MSYTRGMGDKELYVGPPFRARVMSGLGQNLAERIRYHKGGTRPVASLRTWLERLGIVSPTNQPGLGQNLAERYVRYSKGGVRPMRADEIAALPSQWRPAVYHFSGLLDPRGGIVSPTNAPRGGIVSPTNMPMMRSRLGDVLTPGPKAPLSTAAVVGWAAVVVAAAGVFWAVTSGKWLGRNPLPKRFGVYKPRWLLVPRKRRVGKNTRARSRASRRRRSRRGTRRVAANERGYGSQSRLKGIAEEELESTADLLADTVRFADWPEGALWALDAVFDAYGAAKKAYEAKRFVAALRALGTVQKRLGAWHERWDGTEQRHPVRRNAKRRGGTLLRGPSPGQLIQRRLKKARKHREEVEAWRTRSGQFGYSDMDRMCVCGHPLGEHGAAGPRMCFADDYACAAGCKKFRPVRVKKNAKRPAWQVEGDIRRAEAAAQEERRKKAHVWGMKAGHTMHWQGMSWECSRCGASGNIAGRTSVIGKCSNPFRVA